MLSNWVNSYVFINEVEMTNEDKKLVFEYMGWCFHRYAKSGLLWGTGICVKCKDPRPKEHPLDGNDMVAAINKMEALREWDSFYWSSWGLYEEISTVPNRGSYSLFTRWLMQPARFFELMAKWLEVRNAKI